MTDAVLMHKNNDNHGTGVGVGGVVMRGAAESVDQPSTHHLSGLDVRTCGKEGEKVQVVSTFRDMMSRAIGTRRHSLITRIAAPFRKSYLARMAP